MKEQKRLRVKDESGAYIYIQAGDRVTEERPWCKGTELTKETVRISGTVYCKSQGMNDLWWIRWDDGQELKLKEGCIVCKQ